MMDHYRLGILGLGYVGLPLAVSFGKKYSTVGFDIKPHRIEELRGGIDKTFEVSTEELKESKHLVFSSQPHDLKSCNIFIVTVPTPIDQYKNPDLTPVRKASEMIGALLKQGDIIIYESTVYPGVTEEICVPILEKISRLTFNKDFFVGYSPERVNPGDRERRLSNTVKITSGSTPEVACKVDELYRTIIEAGTFMASSIKVAEAAKVVENIQRDINIALMNELAMLFHKLSIDTVEVLQAAGTKWNFIKLFPGLVGGHCISVDPYYLIHKAQEIGHYPEIMVAARRANDAIESFVAHQVIKLMIKKNILVQHSKILLMGLTFKENCPDIRNTRVIPIRQLLMDFGCEVDIYDPWVDNEECQEEYQLSPVLEPKLDHYDALVLTVSHQLFKDKGFTWCRSLGKENCVVYDVKSIFPRQDVDGRL